MSASVGSGGGDAPKTHSSPLSRGIMAMGEDEVSRTDSLLRLRASLDAMVGSRVTLLGDVMLDRYVIGEVHRISPEAPVPVFEAKKRENRLGGAANVALNIQALGATPILCGIIGNDIKGKVFNEVLENQHLSTEGIIQSDERLTTCKTRIISSSHHMLRVDEEVLEPISELDSKDLINRVKNIISTKKIDVVIFEDYLSGGPSVS